MKKILSMFLVGSFFLLSAQAQQTRYIIKFKDKATSPFTIANPSAYLGPRAIQRRLRYNIAVDSFDLPVTPRYIDSVRLAGVVTILNSSKWLNQVTIKTTDAAALAKINNLPFVKNVSASASRQMEEIATPVNKKLDNGTEEIFSAKTADITGDVSAYGNAGGQIKLHNGQFLHEHGFKGQGMQISVLDGGFYHYLTLPTFDSARANNQIINVWDFVENNSSVDEDNSHGMSCFSTISANMPGVFVGTAPKANYCLYRTEDVATETNIEEHNLAAGYERADSLGVDVCTVSLGYTTFDYPSQNYTYASMNGNTSMSAIASDIAAKKGMLPVIACGNDGNTTWRFVASPGDADSVLTIGAVDTLGNVGSFSSYGPTSNGRIKPNVAATGVRAVVANPGTGLPMYGNGTSYATPNMAGLTTCLWQAFPEVNNMAIIDAVQKSASIYGTPNDRIGYGIPNMKKAFVLLMRNGYSRTHCITNNIANVQLNIKLDNTMKITVERKLSTESNFSTFKVINGTGSFTNKNLSFAENFVLLQDITASYKIKIDIAADTSFYVDAFDVNQFETCTPAIDEVKVNPNPVSDFANVMISRKATGKMAIVMMSATGQVMYKTNYEQKVAGTYVKFIDMRNMSRGVYFVSVFADDKKIETIQILK
jgi:serine protease AprX